MCHLMKHLLSATYCGLFFSAIMIAGCSGGNGGAGTGVDTPPEITLVRSRALSDSDGVYATGKTVRIDVEVPPETTDITSGTIRITSVSQGYDSGVQPLKFGSIFFEWDTTGLNPASDYVVDLSLSDSAGQTTEDNSLTLTLAPNPPAINKLVSEVDISVPSSGLPVRVVRSYLLDSTFDGPMGYGWTHTYRMRAVETKTNIIASLVLIPVDGRIQIFNADGTGSSFSPKGDGTYQSPKGDFRTLTKNPDGTNTLREKSGTVFQFDLVGRLTSISDRNGNALTLNYNAKGLVETIVDASGQTTTFAYNTDNRISSITDPLGKTILYAYDAAGNLVSVTDTGGSTTTYAYDENHNLTTVTDPAGRQTFFTTDSEDRLASMSGAGGENNLSYQYGVPSLDKMTVTDALGQQTVLTYDTNASVTQVTDPSGNTTSMVYDTNFNLTLLTDAKGGATSFSYDTQGNVLSTTDAQGNVVTLTYEPQFNQVTSLTDANGNSTSFAYDANGNLNTMTYPGGATETFAYDAVGNLSSKTDRKGQTIAFTYSSSGQLTQKTFPDSSSDTFSYDVMGNLKQSSDENGNIDFTYGPSDRLTSVTYPGGEVVAYVYDSAGNRTQLIYPDGMVLDYSYDVLGRLAEISRSGLMVAKYTYDALSRVVQRDLKNGTFTTYSYDLSSQLLDLINRKSTSEIISSFTYKYDSLGNRTKMITLDGPTQYLYDQINQLTRVVLPDGSTTDYNFDSAGNRSSVINSDGSVDNYSANNQNQYTDVDGDMYTYDANGNMTSKTTADGMTSYTYDFENRLVQVVGPTETVSYAYDSFGRRILKTTSTDTTKFIHDGFRVILEKDGANILQASYLHGRWIDEILFMKRGGLDYYYSQDGQGSTVNLTDISEGIIDAHSYDVYGKPNTTSTVGNPYLFAGREYELETGLYYNRLRYYDQGLGKFISNDPLGLSGGINLSRYVLNNPINFVDPFGLVSIQVFGSQLGLTGSAISGRNIGANFASGNFRDAFLSTSTLFITAAASLASKRLNLGVSIAFTTLDLIKVGQLSYGIFDAKRKLKELNKRESAGDGGETGTDDDSGAGGGGGCDEATDVCAPDPTFIQLSSDKKRVALKDFSRLFGKSSISADALVAKISVPYQNALVRGDIPIFGLAHGENFERYRVELGEGDKPTEWVTLTTSTKPQTKRVSAADLDDSANTTIHGNLATWDTGLKNYVYLPSHPADHPIDLNGTYTIRLIVTGKDSSTVEDRVTVDVAYVIPNAWGGFAKSKDGKVLLSIAEQSLMDSFRLIAIQEADEDFLVLPIERQLIGSIYNIREPGERFTKEAILKMTYSPEDTGATTTEHLGIYGYNTKTKAWEYLASERPQEGSSVLTKVRQLHGFYALMASDLPGEGSSLQPPILDLDDFQKVSTTVGRSHYLVQDTFEENVGHWKNRSGEVGAEVALDNSVTFDGTKALKIVNTQAEGNFAVNIGMAPFDVRDYPMIQFDYRISADVKTNFLVKVSGRWYDIGFTDDPKDFKDKRVNIAHIGEIKGVLADDTWHTARFNLYEMLRTQTGNTVVEEMVMADWDVGGYMKLQFGKNYKGATYYIDNFTIGRNLSAGLRLKGETILVDSFNQKKETNALGGSNSIFMSGTDEQQFKTTFSQNDALGKGHALSLSYDVSAVGSYAGYTTHLGSLDLREFRTLTFFVMGAEDGEDLLVGLKDHAGKEQKLSVSTYLVEKISASWQQVTIPLIAFSQEVDLSRIKSLNLSFQHGIKAKGTLVVDAIEFHQTFSSVVVDNLEEEKDTNLLGRKHWTFAYGTSAINGIHTKNSPNGIYAISYGGNIGEVFGYNSGLNYAGWTTGLGGIDCSHCQSLSFRIRGADGGEKPNIYLSDGNFRWSVDIEKYTEVRPEWQQVTIPLSAYADYGVDLTHLAELQLAFEWEKMSGTVFIDDIRFGQVIKKNP